MSEKAECPRCGSYVSEIFYELRHRYCGWNCCVAYTVSAWSEDAHAELHLGRVPTDGERDALAALVGAESTEVSYTIDGWGPEGIDRKSPWLDPDQITPKPLSTRKAKAALKELRDRVVDRDIAGIDAALKT